MLFSLIFLRNFNFHIHINGFQMLAVITTLSSLSVSFLRKEVKRGELSSRIFIRRHFSRLSFALSLTSFGYLWKKNFLGQITYTVWDTIYTWRWNLSICCARHSGCVHIRLVKRRRGTQDCWMYCGHLVWYCSWQFFSSQDWWLRSKTRRDVLFGWLV